VAGNIIHQSLSGPVERYTPSQGLKESILFLEIVNFVFLGRNKKQCRWHVNEPKATGARSSRPARAAKTH
jgi:hypothetical protein